jgi:hypothetical protein
MKGASSSGTLLRKFIACRKSLPADEVLKAATGLLQDPCECAAKRPTRDRSSHTGDARRALAKTAKREGLQCPQPFSTGSPP